MHSGSSIPDGNTTNHELLASVDEIACAPVLLVASDFDGTLASIVTDPAQARPDREAAVAVRTLSELPQTHVAVISGRALGDLAGRMTGFGRPHLVGSHGSESEAGFGLPLPPESLHLLQRLKQDVSEIAKSIRGSWIEEKPAAIAFHYRNAEGRTGEDAAHVMLRDLGSLPGVFARRGKSVVELSVVQTNKGLALRRLRQRLGAVAVLFVGDDSTDEDAFDSLNGPDLGIKVGPGDTRAPFRIGDPADVARVLARVAERRTEWLAGSHATPIERHSLLSDQRTVALVDPTGRLVWMCLPRIDSSAVFAELLGGPKGGYFEVTPFSTASAPKQRYVADTFVLETVWPQVRLTDYLDCCGSRAFQRAGRSELLRVIKGSGRIRVTFAPRLDFGRVETRLKIQNDGVEVEGAVDPCVLRAPGLPWKLITDAKHQTAIAEFELNEDPIVLELRYGTANLAPDPLPEPVRRQRTLRFWSAWADALQCPKVARDLVRRSALVLKALTYGPTGAICAAATTSLPEHFGGVRNWDYRYCWLRDAAMAASSLVQLGVTGPAVKLLDWILGILEPCEPGTLLAPVYTVTGRHLGPEGDIMELTGYRGSRPVRVGNLAAQQTQLDTLGPIADLLARLAQRGEPLSTEHWHLMEAMVGTVARRWQDADHGIWEVRRPRQQHVHSKVMCWQTVDRALTVAHHLGRRCSEWGALRDQIAADVLTRGWSDEHNSFCATYDEYETDAAALSVGLSGLLPYTDPRVHGTIDRVEQTLRVGPTVYRYRYDDGLPGSTTGFHLCTSWLIESYAGTGRRDVASALFEQLTTQAGPTGMLAEQYDPNARCSQGNLPQAYSHLGLINAAFAVSQGHAPATQR